jgi:signal peptidase I
MRDIKRVLKKLWHFIWEEDSLLSWIVNVILAFVLIKFIIYPGLGLLLGTSYPVVAVVSGSMEHDGMFEQWWQSQEMFYQTLGITKEKFLGFKFRNGFNTGDIMVLNGVNAEDIKVGDVIVYRTNKPDPVIHRVVRINYENGKYYFQTKGDHNRGSSEDEKSIEEERIIGKAFFRIPLLGWIKIGFVELLRLIRVVA